MRRCFHCKRSLESQLHAAGPNLGESYVVLGASTTSPSGLLLSSSSSSSAASSSSSLNSTSAGLDFDNGSDTQSFIATPISPMQPISPILMDYFSAQRPTMQDGVADDEEEEDSAASTKILREMDPMAASSSASSVSASTSSSLALGDATSAALLGESVACVATHADLSRYVETITKQRAHCAGLAITSPVCKECIDGMTEEIDRKAECARLAKRTFTSHLHTLSSSSFKRDDAQEVVKLEHNLAKLGQQQSFLQDNLKLMQKERQQLAQSHLVLNDHLELLHQQAHEFWLQVQQCLRDKSDFDAQRDRCTCQLEQLDKLLGGMQAQNVLNDAFYIWHAGDFGTINGFRMGQLDDLQVDWNEINAALGESALLLCTVSSIVGLTFTKFKIVPLGSFSKVIRLNSLPHMEYKLHGTEQDNYPESHFNLGLVAWLECLAQLMRFVAAKDHKMHFPYKIRAISSSAAVASNVGGLSVCFLKNKPKREWTKALKYALTNMKWLIAWTSTRVLAQKV